MEPLKVDMAININATGYTLVQAAYIEALIINTFQDEEGVTVDIDIQETQPAIT